MNRKASTVEKIGGIAVIVVMLVMLLLFVNEIASGGSKALLKSIENILPEFLKPEEKDLTTLNNLAQKNFDLLIQEINPCVSSQKKDCKCKSQKGFNDFNEVHALNLITEQGKDKIKLLIVKDKNELTKDQKDLTAIKCYATRNNVRYLTMPIMIRFDDNTYLKDSNGENKEFLKNSKDILYKTQNNEICWLVEEKDVGYC